MSKLDINSRQHLTIFPKEAYGNGIAVCWYEAENGRFYGLEYWTDRPECHKRMMALFRRMASQGRLTSDNGHWLTEQYKKVYEFTPMQKPWRFMAFQEGRILYITNGADKAKDKKQARHYELALQLSKEFPRASHRFIPWQPN